MKYNILLFSLPGLVLATAQSLEKRAPAAYHDYGEIRLAVTTGYAWSWDDTGSGARRDVTLYHPNQDGNFRALGGVAETAHSDTVNGKRATLIAALNPNKPPADASKPALKDPTGWTLIWNDRGSGGKHDGSIWRPDCSDGYVSLGDVGVYGYGKPTRPIWCVRQDLVRQGTYKTSDFWNDGGSGADKDAYLWEVIPASPGVSGTEDLPLYAGTFRVVNVGGRPNVPTWTLAVKVPKDYTQFRAKVPNITADTIPSKGEVFEEMKQAEVTLPLTAFYQPKAREILDNMKSPFASISRIVAWYVEGVWENKTKGKVTRSDEIQYGFTKENTTSFEHSVGVSITAGSGVKLVDYSVSLNYQFTYSTSSSYSEFSSYTKREEFNVPAQYVTVMFCKRVRINVALVDGTLLDQGDSLASGEFHLSGSPL